MNQRLTGPGSGSPRELFELFTYCGYQSPCQIGVARRCTDRVGAAYRSSDGVINGRVLAHCRSAAGRRSVVAPLSVSEVIGMDPITLIVAALAAGAGLGVQDTASAMVKDAYAGLKALVKKRLGGGSDAELVLAKHERAPETWQAPLMAELAETGADSDRDLIAAAEVLLDLVSEARGKEGKYTVDVRGAQGVQIGDDNRQDNVFNVAGDG